MPYTAITKPTQGDATKKSLADALIDNDSYFNGEIQKIKNADVPNGSFELDSDADNYPDGWTWAASGSGGSGTIDTADETDGAKSFKIVHPGGAGNGGGSITTTDFMTCSPQVPVFAEWEQKSSVAGVRNMVQIQWFDDAQASISTSTIYDSTNNPTAWKLQHGGALPPATARYFKLKLIGGDTSNSTGGTIRFDNVRIMKLNFLRGAQWTAAGTYTFFAPVGVPVARITCVGGGGGGGAAPNPGYAGGGGGGGGTMVAYVTLTAGSSYTVVVGAAGTAGVGASGGAGGNSTFGSTVVVGNGGNGGAAGTVSAAGAGGTGGSGSTTGTQITLTAGTNGNAGDGSPGAQGGGTAYAGNASSGTAGNHPGGGGGGSVTYGAAGAVGAAGLVLIEW